MEMYLSYSIYRLYLVCLEVAENLVQYGLGLRSTNGMGASAVPLDLLVLAGIIVVSKSTYRWSEAIPRRRQNSPRARPRQRASKGGQGRAGSGRLAMPGNEALRTSGVCAHPAQRASMVRAEHLAEKPLAARCSRAESQATSSRGGWRQRGAPASIHSWISASSASLMQPGVPMVPRQGGFAKLGGIM